MVSYLVFSSGTYLMHVSAREPSPIRGSFERVKVGDVGYVRKGRFHLLFSAGREPGNMGPGANTPRTFEPLTIGKTIYNQSRPPGYLYPGVAEETRPGPAESVDTNPCALSVKSILPRAHALMR